MSTQFFNSNSIFPGKLNSLKELEENISRRFVNRKIVFTEKLDGTDVRFFVTNKVIRFFSKDKELLVGTPLHSSVISLYNSRYSKFVGRVFSLFEHSDLLLFFELVDNSKRIRYFNKDNGQDLYLYDIYINGNWVNWDDIFNVGKTCDINTVPFLEFEVFGGIDQVKKLMAENTSKVSELANAPMEGIVMRPFLEDYCTETPNNRLIAKFTNPLFYKPKPEVIRIPAPITTTGTGMGHYFAKAGEFLDSNIDEIDCCLWKDLLEKKEIEVNVKNLSKIMPVVVEFFLNEEHKKNIDEFCKANNLDLDKFLKGLKRILPSKIRKGLNI